LKMYFWIKKYLSGRGELSVIGRLKADPFSRNTVFARKQYTIDPIFLLGTAS